MTIGTTLGSIALVGVVALSACGSDSVDDAAPEASTTTTTIAAAAPTSTTQPADLEMGEVPVSETLDPSGSVKGGTVGLSYIYDTYPAALGGIVGLAVTDLAGRLDIAESAITVVVVEEVVWSDGSHGCPQPGMSYTQVLTDGLRIVLEANGQVYDYRSGGVSDPVLCVQAPTKDETRAGVFELTPEGEVIVVPAPDKGTGTPEEGINPPDE